MRDRMTRVGPFVPLFLALALALALTLAYSSEAATGTYDGMDGSPTPHAFRPPLSLPLVRAGRTGF